MSRQVVLKVEVLEEWIMRQHLNQAEFAQRCGLSHAMVSQVLRSKKGLSARSREKVQRVTGLEWDDLFEIRQTG